MSAAAGRHSQRWNKMTPMSKEANCAMFALTHDLPMSPVLPGIPSTNLAKTLEESHEVYNNIRTLSGEPKSCGHTKLHERRIVSSLSIKQTKDKSECPCLKAISTMNVRRSDTRNKLRQTIIVQSDAKQFEQRDTSFDRNVHLTKAIKGLKKQETYNEQKFNNRPNNCDSKLNLAGEPLVNSLPCTGESQQYQLPEYILDRRFRSSMNNDNFSKHKPETEIKTTKSKRLHISSSVLDTEYENKFSENIMNNTKTICEHTPTPFGISKSARIHYEQNSFDSSASFISPKISSSLPIKKLVDRKKFRSSSLFDQSGGIQTGVFECTPVVRTTDASKFVKRKNVANTRINVYNDSNMVIRNGFNRSLIKTEAKQQIQTADEYRARTNQEPDCDYQRDKRRFLATREKTFRISGIDYDCRYDFDERSSPVESFSDDEKRRLIQESRSRAVKKCRLWLRKYHVSANI